MLEIPRSDAHQLRKAAWRGVSRKANHLPGITSCSVSARGLFRTLSALLDHSVVSVILRKCFERTVSAQEAVCLASQFLWQFLICCRRQFFSWNRKHRYYYTYPREKEIEAQRGPAQVPLEKPDLNL